MNNKRATKRALLTSVMALVMCVVMLVGTTFAWFTDTASTAVNKIQAGNLKMEVSYKNTPDGELKTLNESTNVFMENALWEPGHVEYAVLNVKNIGTLALKYKLGINIASETGSTNVFDKSFKLSDYIKFAVIDGDQSALDRDNLVAAATDSKLIKEGYTKESQLRTATDTNAALKNDETVTLVVWMPTDVGNNANYKVGETVPEINLGINVVATQYTYENDSFGNTYDKDATYPAANADELKSALAAGGIVNVATDLPTNNIDDSVDARMVIKAPTTLNLDKKIISPNNMGNNNINFCALIVDADTTINAGESGGIDTGENGGYGINVRNGATLTINGGSYYGGGTAVQVQKGTLIINGGHFACEPYSNPVYGYKYLINCIDSAYKDGSAKIIIKGGTFVNFDPSDSASENPHGNFVADGYKVVSEAHGTDTWYTVVSK